MREEAARANWYGDPESSNFAPRLPRRHSCSPANVVVGAGIDDLLGLGRPRILRRAGSPSQRRGRIPRSLIMPAAQGAILETVPYGADFGVAGRGVAAARARAERDAGLSRQPRQSQRDASLEAEAVEALVDGLARRQRCWCWTKPTRISSRPTRLPPDRIDPRVIRMRTFSKAYGLAGMRIGYALGHAAMCETFGKIRLQYGVNRTAQAGRARCPGATMRSCARWRAARPRAGLSTRRWASGSGCRCILPPRISCCSTRARGRGPKPCCKNWSGARSSCASPALRRWIAASGSRSGPREQDAFARRFGARLAAIGRGVSRLAIVSDIHSNLEALQAVARPRGPGDALLCLGDTVGYGPNPNECVELVRARARGRVMGNHDLAAIEGYGVEYFNPAARSRRRMDASECWPKSTPRGSRNWSTSSEPPEFLLVHGAPERYFSYILDAAGARRAFAATDADVIFVGHSHVAEYYALTAGRDRASPHAARGQLTLVPGVRYIINAGSVGQPRDLNPEASFARFDPPARTIVWAARRATTSMRSGRRSRPPGCRPI